MQRPDLTQYRPREFHNIEKIYFDGTMIGKCDKVRIEPGKSLRIIFYNIPSELIQKHIIGNNSIVEVVIFTGDYKTILITGLVDNKIPFNPTSLETQVVMYGDVKDE